MNDDSDASLVQWQVLPQWRDFQGRHWADPTHWHTDQHEAWADFHAACVERGRDRIDYTVDLIRSGVYRDKQGHWRSEGPARIIERWPGGMTATDTRPDLAALANKMRLPDTTAEKCSAGCGRPADRYDPDGRPFCNGHLPRSQPA